MRRITVLLTIIHIVVTQMTFTDNWDKRTLPNLFRGLQRDDLYVFPFFFFFIFKIMLGNI